MTFVDAFNLLIKIQASKAKNTRDQTNSIIENHLRPWFSKNTTDLEAFEKDFEETWSMYVAHCNEEVEEGKSPRRLGHDRRYLVMALRRAHTKGWITRAFSKTDFPLMEFAEPIGKLIGPGSLEMIKDFLKLNSPRTYLQVLMASQMGMRISEILKLSTEEVDIVNREIRLDPRRLKTRKSRQVPILITDDALPLLKARCEASTGPYIFPFSRGGIEDPAKPQRDNGWWWDKAREYAVADCRFHDLRHTAISNAIGRGMDPITASKYFGASQAVINRIYYHIRPEDKEKHRAMMGSG